LLTFHMKRFEKEKKRLEAQYKRQLAEEKERFDKMRRDLEKERKRFQKERAKVSDSSTKIRQKEYNLKSKRKSMQAKNAKEKRLQASEQRMSKSQYISLLRQIRTEKAELLTLRERIRQERKILKEERKALDRDRNIIKEQRGGVLEAFASGYKPKGRSKRSTPKSSESKRELGEEEKVFSPDSDYSEDSNTIDQAYSFFTEEERNKRKSDRQRLISESWDAVKLSPGSKDEFSCLCRKESERIDEAVRTHGLLPKLWDIVDHICDHLDHLENLIPQLREFALFCFQNGLLSEDHGIMGECLVKLMSESYGNWGDAHTESWNWCLDLVTSTLVTSHELEVAKQEAGDSFNVEDFELGSEFSVDLGDFSDFEFSVEIDEEDLDESILDNL